MKRRSKKRSFLRNSRNMAIGIFLIAAVAALTWLLWPSSKNTANVGQPSNTDTTKSGNSRQNTAKSSQQNASGSKKIQEGQAVDKGGQNVGQTPPSSQWTTSASGLITLKQPVNNSTFKSGDAISGTAKVSQVWYRLIDNNAGLIGQGPLNVVNGKFSATVNFRASSASGRLDVYSYQNGVEANEISINLNF